MSTLTSNASALNKSAEATAELHKSLLSVANSNEPYPNPIGEAAPVISFNGYYALNDTGAFLTIDTNMLVKNGKMTPHVILIYSPDGTQSTLYDLTGKGICFETVEWDSATNTLSAISGDENGPSFYLTFTREDNAREITASVSGKVQWGPKDAVTSTPINGHTYNNPIPMTMYAGTYYENAPGAKPGKGAGDGSKIMVIGTDNTLQYNFTNTGDPGGQLQNVDTFVYNLNMYVFSFNALYDTIFYSIIMGTSASGGMVCNDLVDFKGVNFPIPRSLQTISTVVDAPVNGTNANSEQFAAFAGFYRLSSGPNAFLSIEGSYKTHKDGSTEYTVTMGHSKDGNNLTMYTFDSTMSFDGSVLNIPNPDASKPAILNLTFTRSYQNSYEQEGPFFGSVVQVSGHHNGHHVTGETLLNVVPLMGFAGATLKVKGKPEDTIVINSNKEVTFKTTSYQTLTVVPLMYIVGFIDDQGMEVIFSLGTDGGKGNTCLTTVKVPAATSKDEQNAETTVETPIGKLQTPKGSIELYSAIPDGLSGSPQEQKSVVFEGPTQA